MESIVPGREKRLFPIEKLSSGYSKLSTKNVVQLFEKYTSSNNSPIVPGAIGDWQAIAKELGLNCSQETIDGIITKTVQEVSERLAWACFESKENRSRATSLDVLAEKLFSLDSDASDDDEKKLFCMRGLLFVRACGDLLQDKVNAPRFRVHTFLEVLKVFFCTGGKHVSL